jgi:DNA-directed RNA polymerase alpha subunit
MNANRPIATLSEHDLPKRARNALLRGGIATLKDAAEWSDRDLLSLPHIGRAYVASLRALMAGKAD